MALQILQVCRPVPLTSSSSLSNASHPSCFAKKSTVFGEIHQFSSMMIMINKKNENMKAGLSSSVTVRSSMETTGPTVVVGQVTEVNIDTFWPLVNAAGDKTVVLDMYTQWCGPCKVIAPKYKELSEKYLDVVFLKLDCNQENKALAKELGLKVVPTFKIIKDGKIVKEVTGAKFDKLAGTIEEVRTT
ncbi:thioredoxin F-type, chloroplastic-like [Rutidosis leptorrhynchoides]|uniref:thioredoxin F-type, chloroplastic-like n=1 Tax=Rutidosis leptorrhynchoides TaxID=125765 RepID=UPI003A9912D7